MTKARELAELARTISDTSDATAITIDSSENTTFTGVVTANAGVVIDSMTIDAGQIDLSSGDLTLDVAGDIILDAAGNDVIFKDAGTTFGQITNDSGNMIIYNAGSQMLKGVGGGANAQFVGSVGIGVTPSAWGSGWVAAQVGVGSTIAGRTTDYTNTNIVSNAYFDGSNWKYLSSNTASKYYQLAGSHIWDTAASGTAGNNITFSEAMRIDSAGDARFAANATGAALIKGVSGDQTDRNSGGYPQFTFVGNEGTGIRRPSANVLALDTSGDEAMRLTSGGIALFGKTAVDNTTQGIQIDGPSGFMSVARDAGIALLLDRSNDGEIQRFTVDGSTIGSIGTNSGYMVIGSLVGTDAHLLIGNNLIHPATSTGGVKDAAIDLGGSSNRFKDLYLSGSAFPSSIGINQSSVSRRKLEITDQTPGLVLYDTNVTNLAHEIVGGGNAGLEISADFNNVGTGYIRFDVGGSEAMRISGGNVGIGTSSMDGRLKISAPAGNSASADLTLWGNNSGAYGGTNIAKSKISSFSDGTAYGANLAFYTNDTSNSYQERMRISSSGAVTMPYQPAFQARLASTQYNVTSSTTPQTVLFASEVFDQNSDFNASAYVFNAPVAGRYAFDVHVLLSSVDTAAHYYQLQLVTSNRIYYNTIDPRYFSADLAYWALNISCLADMDASDTAIVKLLYPNGTSQTDLNPTTSFFSGYLVA